MEASDATLVNRVLRGDRCAFADLYDRRARLIRAICYAKTRDTEAAADLTQEAFLRAYSRLGQLADPEKFTRWLAGIARQVCREFARGRIREHRRLAVRCALDPTARTGRADPEVSSEDDLDRLRDAVASLPGKERLAMYAFYLQELDVEQARATLGLSRSGLYRVLSCARARLRRMLSRAEVVR